MVGPNEAAEVLKHTSAVNSVIQLYRVLTKKNLEKLAHKMALLINHIPDKIVEQALFTYKSKCQKEKEENENISHPNYFIAVCLNVYQRQKGNIPDIEPDLNKDTPPLAMGRLI